MSERPKVFFYVQHLLGIGHLARASRVAEALAENGFAVSLVTGGSPVPGFPPAGMDHVALPPIAATDQFFSGLIDPAGKPVDDAYRAGRARMLLAALKRIAPDIVLIEAFPFGRRQMRFELLPLIEAVEAMEPGPLLVSSVRDILQERQRPGRDEETVDLVRAHFDLVMVHGDPEFAPLDLSFPLAPTIADKIAYTGLVAAPPALPSTERYDVLASAGGGAAARMLAGIVVDAAAIDADRSWCLITGPNLPESDFETVQARAPENLSVFRFRTDFRSLLGSAGVSVSQAGYNTVCDVLAAGCRSILVPFTAGGETEQAARAWRLEQLGLATMLAEQGLSAAALADAVRAARAAPAPVVHGIDLDGAGRAAALLRQMIDLGSD